MPVIEHLRAALIQNLAILDRENPDRCRLLLAEGPFKQRKREDLKQRLQRLQRAKQSIRNFAARG
jgi:hypothetical protein